MAQPAAEMTQRYLELATRLMEQAQRMTSGSVSCATLQFNRGQCEYLASKLEKAVQSAQDCIWSYSPDEISECLENMKLLVRLAKDVESFIHECCREEWIQAAAMLMNGFEHVASLNYHLELCTVVLRNRNTRLGMALRRVLASISEAEDLDLKERVSLDHVNLVKKLGASIQSSDSRRSQESQLGSFLLERLKAAQQAEPDPTPDHKPGNSPQLSLWKVEYASLERVELLGNGSAGSLHRAMWLGAPVAEKTFFKTHLPSFRAEVEILAGLSHSNILPMLYYGMQEEREYSIIMELMDGDLQDLMRKRLACDTTRTFPFSLDEAVDIMLQIAEGMRYLHQKRVVHGDLKSPNILVKCAVLKGADDDVELVIVHAKVADFGLSKTKERSTTFSNQTLNKGTHRWMPPESIHLREQRSHAEMEDFTSPGRVSKYFEVFIESMKSKIRRNQAVAPTLPQGASDVVSRPAETSEGRCDAVPKHPFKGDVYSFAMVCYEVLTGEVPFPDISNPNEVKRKVLGGDRPELPGHCPPTLGSMIRKCWVSEPSARPKFAEICTELRFMKCSLMIEIPKIAG